jgi:2-haloacid dehalogenase/putative hydrolase of the HAD superfamily
MEHHGICADGVITSEDVRSYKPRPELFQEALRRYNMLPDEVIHIGDSIVSDVYGAQEAGIDAVWLNRKGKTKPVDIEPKYVCKDLDEVKVILKQ